ncbi:MAG: retron system putative HNH endonuclease [Pseudomonas veronii]|uniref:retron system putative HNH endonuclease n=1 Tax=Pseudomonas veronii TaxID=76761 RepID=UPI003C731AEE
MIKLSRMPEPQYLIDNKEALREALEKAIDVYGSYEFIPKLEKERLVSYYRHKDIKAPLVESSYGKCAFCECIPSEGGNVEVEHYKPKSLYPELTFEWMNLLPSCHRCNGDKSDHDTGIEPIINPYEDDPSEIFYYSGLNIKGVPGDFFEVAERTIEVCGLNSLRLWEPRSKIYVSMHDFEMSLLKAVQNYEEALTPIKKRNRLRAIRDSIDRIELLARECERYSSFCASFLIGSEIYAAAKKIASE